MDIPPKYEHVCSQVNGRGDGSYATLTDKREMENYLHPDAIEEVYGFQITFTDTDDVPQMVAEAVHASDPANRPWVEVDPAFPKIITCSTEYNALNPHHYWILGNL